MTRKFVYCVLISVLLLLSAQVYAAIQVSSMPMEPNGVGQWPAVYGTPKIQTCNDPNELPSYSQDPDLSERNAENHIGGRGVMQTFEIPADGFTLSRIVIRAGGGGNDTTGPYTIHIYDVNSPEVPTASLPGSYRPSTDGPYIPAVDLLSDATGFLGNVELMQYANDDHDELVTFDFTEDDAVDFEPNHVYAFEIWGPTNVEGYPFLWIRYQSQNPYGPGDGYECPGERDDLGDGPGPSVLSNLRSQLSGAVQDTVTAVYGVPYDGNAFNPIPRKYETGISLNPTLTWRPGKWADDTLGHQVWFSTSINAVMRRLITANKGRVTDPCYTPPGPLALNTTYYWRIDEYNDTPTVSVPVHPDGNSYWGVDSESGVDKPTIYRFTTLTPQAHTPVPVSGTLAALNVKPLQLSWQAGALVADTAGHRVFFGTNFDDVNNATTSTPVIYRGAVDDTAYSLLNLLPDYTLSGETTYYWRVDEVNGVNVWKGTTWSFTMQPFLVVDSFSYSNQGDMNDVWRNNYTTCMAESGSIGGRGVLTAGVMRIDYDDSASLGLPWTELRADNGGAGLGMDWTAGGLVDLDSFSIGVDGNIFNSNDPDYDRIYVGIEDIYGNINVVYNDDPIFQKRAFGGASNRQWNIPLSVLSNNGVVSLTDVNVLYIGFGTRCSWGPREWGPYGGTGAVTIDNIRLYMSRCLTQYGGQKGPAGSGDVAGPINGAGNWSPGDCTVNYFDLDYLFYVGDNDVRYWLDSDVTLTYAGAVAPQDNSSSLMVWYQFDDQSGSSNVVTDSSGNNRHGTVGNPHDLLWATDGVSGNCLNLEAGLRTWVEVPPSAYQPGNNAVTFSFWSAYDMNYNPTGDHAATWASVFTMHSVVPPEDGTDTSSSSQLLEIQLPTPWPLAHDWGPQMRFVDLRSSSGSNVGRPGPQWARMSDYGKRWNHYALVFDGVNKIKAVYENGINIGEVEGDVNVPLPVWPTVNSIRIGTRGNNKYDPASGFMGPSFGFWLGKLDEFRIYNYALTEAEIQWLAKNGAGSRVLPLKDNANLNNDNIINFNDYALMVQKWLNTELWP